MKLKSWLKYLVNIVLIIIMIFLREYMEKIFHDAYYRLESSMFFYLVISSLLGVCIGVLFGFEHIYSEFRKEGKWKINLPKLIILGLPALYFSLFKICFLSGSQILMNVIIYPVLYLSRYGLGNWDYLVLFQILLGYVVITSFFKYREKI